MSKLKMGVLGVGQQGTSHGMSLERDTDHFSLVATCDITPERRSKSEARFGVPCYADMDQLLADNNVDWVVVATPSSLHADHAIRCMRAGKNVVLEKPMCMNAGEAEEVARVAKETGKRLVVFQNRRWDEDFVTAKAAYDSGKLGQVFTVKQESFGYTSALLTFGIKEFRPQWRAEAEWGGGVVYDWGAHRIDQLLFMVKSEPKRVFANLQKKIWSSEVDTQYTIFIEFEDGTSATLENSFVCRSGHGGFLVYGTEGAYQNGKLVTGSEGNFKEEEFKATPAAGGFWASFYNWVVNGGPMPVPLDESLKMMRVTDAVFKSYETRQVVEL